MALVIDFGVQRDARCVIGMIETVYYNCIRSILLLFMYYS